MNTTTNSNTDRIKEEIRARVDIIHIVGRYVHLKSAGQNMKGLCPFHKEKTPSFTVNATKGIFHCFGCGKGGDVFTFIMEIEGISFPEALQRLADETGIQLPKAGDGTHSHKDNYTFTRSDALRIHSAAMHYYYSVMKKNCTAIHYFKSRNLSPDTVKEFKLGYAPKGWNNLTAHARKHKIPVGSLITCGLAVASAQSKEPYDRFRDRIIFPIFDISGQPIAFAGRSLDDTQQPKYLNSPETIIYRKNRVLYGLHCAKKSIQEQGYALIVEGYMDFLALFQAGIRNVVATAGTALTDEHGHILRRFTQKIICFFDGDSAGIAAAQRAIFTLIPLQFDVKICILPNNEDPDTYINNHGDHALKVLIQKSVDSITFLCTLLRKKHNVATPSGKTAVVQYFLPLIHNTDDPVLQATLIKHIAENLDIHEQSIYSKIRRKNREYRSAAERGENEDTIEQYLATEEGAFLHLLLLNPELIKTAQQHISIKIFINTVLKKLYSIIIETYKTDILLKSILDRTDDTTIKRLITLMQLKDLLYNDPVEEVDHKIKRLKRNYLQNRRHIITKKLKSEQNPEIKRELLQQQKELVIQLGEIDRE